MRERLVAVERRVVPKRAIHHYRLIRVLEAGAEARASHIGPSRTGGVGGRRGPRARHWRARLKHSRLLLDNGGGHLETKVEATRGRQDEARLRVIVDRREIDRLINNLLVEIEKLHVRIEVVNLQTVTNHRIHVRLAI